MGKIKLRKQFNDILHDLYRLGYGKSKIKNEHNATPYIHSESTYKTYKAQCSRFADFCYQNGVKFDLNEAFKLIPAYGRKLESEGKSAWTIYTAINAIAKAFKVSTADLGYHPPKRERMSVRRSRYVSEMDRHFSLQSNEALVTFCQCFGLRRREIEVLTGDSVRFDEEGRLCVYVRNGKGGKRRLAQFCGSDKEKQICLNLMRQASSSKVFPHIHSKADIHGYRAVYACRLYKSLARPLKSIPSKDKYVCRKDKAGTVYDKRAMEITSKNLGHNRISVIASSYLHGV